MTKRAEAVGTMLSDAVEQHQPSATKKSLDLSVAPPPSDDFEVGCDRARILQALSNLISNAIKFTDRGSILVSAERNDNEVCFTVADSGPGIPEAERSRIFERYWQATPRARSVGLGLAIARGIVEAHAGRIWVEGRAGGGSTFRFAIPVS